MADFKVFFKKNRKSPLFAAGSFSCGKSLPADVRGGGGKKKNSAGVSGGVMENPGIVRIYL